MCVNRTRRRPLRGGGDARLRQVAALYALGAARLGGGEPAHVRRRAQVGRPLGGVAHVNSLTPQVFHRTFLHETSVSRRFPILSPKPLSPPMTDGH